MFAEELIIRPPSEADSIIIQITRGCSHNSCTFCGAYRNVDFGLHSDSEIDEQIHGAARHCRDQKKVFLGAGDALIVSHERLIEIIGRIKHELPWVNRFSLYANARAIRSKSSAQLDELRMNGLRRVYLGIESGDDTILAEIKKGETYDSFVSAGSRVKTAGIFLSTTVLLGIGGLSRSVRHARKTAELLNDIAPDQIAGLCVMVLDNTELGRLVAEKKFVPLTATQTATELKELLTHLNLDRVQFMANHASNFIPVSGRLRRDKEKMLSQIEQALRDPTQFVPEHLRAL